jgi:hypothetical protein
VAFDNCSFTLTGDCLEMHNPISVVWTKESKAIPVQAYKVSRLKGGKVVSPKHRPPKPPGNISGTHFC